MKYLFAAINIALLAVSLVFCVDIFHKITQKAPSAIPEPQVTDETEPAAPDQVLQAAPKDINRIVERNLFKVEAEKTSAAEKNASKGPVKPEPTTLSLTLWGTVTGGAERYAVIEDKKTKLQFLYQEGDTVQDATIKKIMKNEVILTFVGKDQILKMESDPEKTGAARGPSSNMASSAQMDQNKAQMPPIPVTPPQLQQLQGGTPSQIESKIKLRPFFSKGSPDGVMVYGIKPESPFNKGGLRNGDIVKTINGTAVSSIDDASALLAGLENTDNARVTLVRSGETKEIAFQGGNRAETAADPGGAKETKGEKPVTPEEHPDIKQPTGPDPD